MFCVVLAEIFFIIFVKLFNYNYVVVIVVSYNLSQNAIFCVILAEIFLKSKYRLYLLCKIWDL